MFYKDTMKDGRNLLLPTSFVSTVIICINLMTIYFYLNYKDLTPAVPSKFYIPVFMIIVWIINYYFIITKEEFLKHNFHKNKNGGIAVVTYIVLTALLFIVLANHNREKIFDIRKKNQTELKSN